LFQGLDFIFSVIRLFSVLEAWLSGLNVRSGKDRNNNFDQIVSCQKYCNFTEKNILVFHPKKSVDAIS
jgi:hypothetical protein